MLSDRLLALLGISTILTINATSGVVLNFYIEHDIINSIVGLVYVTILAIVVIKPCIRETHLVLPIVGLIYWSGRGAAFLALVLNGHADLWGEVLERTYIVALLMYWHYWSVHRLTTLRQQRLLTSPL